MKQEVVEMKFNLNDYQGDYAVHCKTKLKKKLRAFVDFFIKIAGDGVVGIVTCSLTTGTDSK